VKDLIPKNAPNVIRALYNTRFFKDVSLTRQDDVLIINVVERPTIGRIIVSGNKQIKSDKLLSALKDLGLTEGHVFHHSVLDKVKQQLHKQYFSLGYYNVKVSTEVSEESRNRVSININISEGSIAKIKAIKIIGNNAFSDSKLVRKMLLTPSGFFTLLSKKDQYSKQKLDADLEALRSFYMDRGYIKFKIISTQVSITPDKKHVFIVIHVDEAALYTIKGFDIGGELILPKDELISLVDIQPGSTFSRKAISEATEAIGKALGDKGYAFAIVDAHPDIDDKRHQVFINFLIKPGHQVYVRHINFTGNVKTADEVLRREMRQMEGGLISISDVRASKRRLDLLGYLRNVQVKTETVPGEDDQVDLNYNVQEEPAAQAIGGIGYGTDGIIFNASLHQNNFLGTGNLLGIEFNHTTYSRSYDFNYYNPYYTQSGIGRGFQVYYQRTKAGKINITRFRTNRYGAALNYSIPLSGDKMATAGVGYQRLELNLPATVSKEVASFVAKNGTNYRQGIVNLGFQENKLDRAIFPTKGWKINTKAEVSLPVGGTPLDYFKFNTVLQNFKPLNDRYILNTLAAFGIAESYGETNILPFFENYYAGGPGGLGAIRGYETNTLGPKDSLGKPIGGNLLMNASLRLIFPNVISQDNVRTIAFVDGGNVYNTRNSVDLADIRFSAGIELDWRSPAGPLEFSFSVPINKKSGDKRQLFQFSVGTSFL